MVQLFSDWFQRHFSHRESISLALFLVFLVVAVTTVGPFLVPVLASLVLAYLLEGSVVLLQQRLRLSRFISVLLVFCGFMAAVVLMMGLTPLLWKQLSNFINELPTFLAQGQALLLQLVERYPNVFSDAMVASITEDLRAGLTRVGQLALSASLSSLVDGLALLVYLILVPLLVFFFLKDKTLMLHWLSQFMPQDRGLLSDVWVRVDEQLGNYIRGKAIEILIVGSVTYVTLVVLDLRYAALLAFLVGLSVLIPYIGATVVTIPIAMVGWVQWGWSNEFITLMMVYGIIQALDANVLVPVLFSGAVNLHPVVIIIAILFFGGLWGFWGVFFAIPLATVVKAVLDVWPSLSGPAPVEEESA